jgi:hypothetical protein
MAEIPSTEPTEFVPPPLRTELLWVALDFDGTVCESTWSPDNPNAVPGPPIQANLDKLTSLLQREPHLKIIIHTSRSWADQELIEKYLLHYNIPFSRIVCGKLLAKYYIDDRAVSAYDPDWCKDPRYAQQG